MTRHDYGSKRERPFKIKRTFTEKVRDFFSGFFKKPAEAESKSQTKLFIGNLSYQATEHDLRNLFDRYGKIHNVDIIVDRRSGQSKGYAFIEMVQPEDATKALALNGVTLLGRPITVSQARSKGDGARDSRRPRRRNSNPRFRGRGRQSHTKPDKTV